MVRFLLFFRKRKPERLPAATEPKSMATSVNPWPLLTQNSIEYQISCPIFDFFSHCALCIYILIENETEWSIWTKWFNGSIEPIVDQWSRQERKNWCRIFAPPRVFTPLGSFGAPANLYWNDFGSSFNFLPFVLSLIKRSVYYRNSLQAQLMSASQLPTQKRSRSRTSVSA